MFTSFYSGEFFAGDFFGTGTPPPAVATTNNYAGGYKPIIGPPLWIAHINGKRYVGTYEEIEAIAESVIVKTEKKPRIVIKPLRKAPEGASVSHEVMAVPDAKRVQERLYIDLMPFLARVLEKRRQDDEDDIEVLMLL